MRIDLEARWDNAAGGWWLRTHADGDEHDLVGERFLRRLAGGAAMAGGFPVPPDDELTNAATEQCTLCAGLDYQVLYKAYTSIAARDAGPDRIRPFADYLFATLLGARAWKAARARANREPIELALRWDAEQADLTRLPWEMMRVPQGYVALLNDPEVSITRIVTPLSDDTTRREEPTRKLSPRVLFIVGTDLVDANIEWGAEYLGLLRHLERDGLSLVSKIVLRASHGDVADAIASFRPSVVHFICHGQQKDGSSSLVLRRDDDNTASADVSPQQLSGLVTGGQHVPTVVVLNACHSGGQHPAYLASPMSAELVRRGVPVVVGMWGQVADQVCRLFTRRFYEALLEGQSIVSAAARGRREGFERAKADPESSPDWAFPAIFLASDVSPELTADDVALKEARSLDRVARQIAASPGPRIFCDRFDVLDRADRYLVRGAAREISVLALESKAPSGEGRNGKTRLLSEIAAQSVRDGLIPCILKKANDEATLVNSEAFVKALLGAIYEARQRFQLVMPDGYVSAKLLSEETDGLPPDVQHTLMFAKPRDDVALAAGLRADLSQLRLDGDAKPIVLLDEVHLYGDGAMRLLVRMLGPAGFGTSSDPVPVAITFGSSNLLEHGATTKTLLDAIGQPNVHRMDVGVLPSPFEDALPYKQFLLFGGERAYIVRPGPDRESYVTAFYERLHKYVGGIPRQLESDGAQATIESYADLQVLVDATDEDRVEAGMGAEQ